MSIALVCLGMNLPLTTPSAIELSVWSGVGGCLCPNSSRMILMYTASRAMMYNAANSASVADNMTCLMTWAMLRTAPLFGGMFAPLERKKCPPVLLHAQSLLR